MIIIAGTIDFESQEARDAAVAKAVPYQESTRADEAGCLGYSFAAGLRLLHPRAGVRALGGRGVPRRPLRAPQLHRDGAGPAGRGRSGGSVAKYRSDLNEPVKDPDGRYRADFFTA